MNNIFTTELNEKLNNRDILQNDFDKAFSEMDKDNLKRHYQALRKIEFESPLDFTFENIDISFLVENITLACDIICAENDISFIYCGNISSHIKGNMKLITKAVLNLLSNALIYGKSGLVTVKTIEKADFVQIEIQNAGWLENVFNFGDGLKYVQNVCDALNGHFFICTDLLSVKSVMMLPKSHDFKDIATAPDFCELLSDRLSPVYVEMFGT